MTLRANRERKLIKYDDNNYYSKDQVHRDEIDIHGVQNYNKFLHLLQSNNLEDSTKNDVLNLKESCKN